MNKYGTYTTSYNYTTLHYFESAGRERPPLTNQNAAIFRWDIGMQCCVIRGNSKETSPNQLDC